MVVLIFVQTVVVNYPIRKKNNMDSYITLLREDDEFIVAVVEDDTINEDKSYYTDDIDDAYSTMKVMAEEMELEIRTS